MEERQWARTKVQERCLEGTGSFKGDGRLDLELEPEEQLVEHGHSRLTWKEETDTDARNVRTIKGSLSYKLLEDKGEK